MIDWNGVYDWMVKEPEPYIIIVVGVVYGVIALFLSHPFNLIVGTVSLLAIVALLGMLGVSINHNRGTNG